MANPATTPDPAIYCRKCSYDLRGQIEHRCPECGRPYDPANANTFRRRPKGRAGQWVKRIAALLVVLLLIAAAPYAWLYYDWRQEQPAVKRMKELGAYVGYKRINPPILPRLLPRDYGWLLERVQRVYDPTRRLTDADMVLLSHCRKLERMFADCSAVSDEGLVAVTELRELRWLVVSGRGITDVSASHLGQRPLLEVLWLFDTSLTDAGVAHLCRLPRLENLAVESPAFTDAGLPALADLPQLRVLAVHAPSIDDDGLSTLSHLSRLESLELHVDRHTTAGAERLRQALPNCRITMDRYSPDPAP